MILLNSITSTLIKSTSLSEKKRIFTTIKKTKSNKNWYFDLKKPIAYTFKNKRKLSITKFSRHAVTCAHCDWKLHYYKLWHVSREKWDHQLLNFEVTMFGPKQSNSSLLIDDEIVGNKLYHSVYGISTFGTFQEILLSAIKRAPS